jgi:hypothetical protein
MVIKSWRGSRFWARGIGKNQKARVKWNRLSLIILVLKNEIRPNSKKGHWQQPRFC